MTVDEIKKKIVPLLQAFRVPRAGLFGSAARGEMGRDSDIDVLVDLRKEASLFEFIELKQELEEALGKKVDLVEYQTIKPRLKESILKYHVALI